MYVCACMCSVGCTGCHCLSLSQLLRILGGALRAPSQTHQSHGKVAPPLCAGFWGEEPEGCLNKAVSPTGRSLSPGPPTGVKKVGQNHRGLHSFGQAPWTSESRPGLGVWWEEAGLRISPSQGHGGGVIVEGARPCLMQPGSA